MTTRDDPCNEIRLQRLYSSAGNAFPVQGRKRKTLTPWTETLFVRGEVFVAEGSTALEQTFDDYAQMRPLGLNAAVNVPLLMGRVCYATFNVFGTRGAWQPEEVLALRLLALAAARWVTPAADLSYTLQARMNCLRQRPRAARRGVSVTTHQGESMLRNPLPSITAARPAAGGRSGPRRPR